MNTTDQPQPAGTPTPGNFRVNHGAMKKWHADEFEQYETFCTLAARTTRGDGDLIWNRTTAANHQICDGCDKEYSGGSCPRCTTTARRVVHVTRATIATARRDLHTARQQLGKGRLHGTRQWRTTLRADGAYALLLAAGVTA